MRTHNWKPGKVNVAEQVKDEDGKDVFEEDGLTPKMEVTEKDSPFTGVVILKVPKYTERLGYMRDCGIGKKNADIDQLKLIEIGIKHITKVELVRTEDEQAFVSVDDLQYDKDGADVLGSIANDIVTGIRLGEISKQS